MTRLTIALLALALSIPPVRAQTIPVPADNTTHEIRLYVTCKAVDAPQPVRQHWYEVGLLTAFNGYNNLPKAAKVAIGAAVWTLVGGGVALVAKKGK